MAIDTGERDFPADFRTLAERDQGLIIDFIGLLDDDVAETVLGGPPPGHVPSDEASAALSPGRG